MIRPIKNYIRKIVFRFIKPQIVTTHVTVPNSYAQVGEDIILKFLFNSVGIVAPSYVDIGSHKSDWGNNTYVSYLAGGKGVSIEPDPGLFTHYKDARPNDICINAAIGFDDAAETDFYLFDEPSLNTMSKEEANRRDSIGEFKLLEKIKVPMLRLENVIENNFTGLPHFISLDAEGVDFDILKSFDFEKYPVPVWVVETVDYSVSYIKNKNLALINFMETKGYFVYAEHILIPFLLILFGIIHSR